MNVGVNAHPFTARIVSEIIVMAEKARNVCVESVLSIPYGETDTDLSIIISL